MSKSPKQADPAHGQEHVHEHEHAHDDDLIVVPPGQSRLKFYSTLALLIFVLLIFTVGPFFEQAAANIFGGGGAKSVTFSWVHPETGETIEYGDMDFLLTKRDLGLVGSFGLYSAPSLRTERGQLSDEDTAMFLVLERLAQDAGIVAGKVEALELLRQVFQSDQILAAQAQRYNRTAMQVSELVARVMAVEKYKGLIMTGASMPDPDRVKELWEEAHPEYAFEYVSVAFEDYEEVAAAETPSDEDLLAWWHEQSIGIQRQLYTEEQFQVEAAWLPFGEDFDSAALLAAYPTPEDWDAETEARNYYNEVVHVRFTEEVPVEEDEESTEGETGEGDDEATEGGGEDEESSTGAETEDETEDETEGATEAPKFETVTRTFEEVQEQAMAEAPMRAAMRAWLVDMRERAATPPPEEGGGEDEEAPAADPVDFAAEAAALGLSFDGSGEPRTREGLQTAEGWGGPFISGSLAFSTPGAFLSNVTVEKGGIVVARLEEKVAGAEPPFEDIRDEVMERWAKEKAGDLALAALTEVFSSLAPAGEAPEDGSGEEEGETAEETEGTEEETEDAPEAFVIDGVAFRAAVTAAGFEVVERDYLERFELPDGDFDAASPGDMYIRVSAPLFELEPGSLNPPAKNAQNTHAFLVRYLDTRPAPMDAMKPRDLMTLRQQASSEASEDFEERFLKADAEFVRNRYQMTMRIWEEKADDPVDADAN